MALGVHTDKAWKNAFKSNTSSVMYMTRAFREMLKNNNGNIVNVASIGGLHFSYIRGKTVCLFMLIRITADSMT